MDSIQLHVVFKVPVELLFISRFNHLLMAKMKVIPVAENESAKGLLDNLSNLMASIEASNKPQTANIRLRGGYGFGRAVAALLTIVGIVVILATFVMLVITMVNLPQATSMQLRLVVATPSLGGLFSGLALLAAGVIAKAVIDTADYNAQLLNLTRKRMEKR